MNGFIGFLILLVVNLFVVISILDIKTTGVMLSIGVFLFNIAGVMGWHFMMKEG